jgi:hypothetical protein
MTLEPRAAFRRSAARPVDSNIPPRRAFNKHVGRFRPKTQVRFLSTSLGLMLAVLIAPGVARAADGVEFFEERVRPLLSEHCYKCHSASAEKLKGGLLLDTRQAVLKGGDTGPALVAGDPERSLLVKAVRYADADMQMPPDGKLSDAQIADLEAWVRMGAPDPRDGAAPLPAQPGNASPPAAGIDLAEGRKWWAFQPVKDHPAPSVARADWPRGPLDRFILAELEKKQLPPAAPADKRTLIRRAYYDLVGLPPTPEEVEAFVADAAPDAFARVVDRLLASPHYGERWGRHWLDVVRYTDALDARGIGGDSDVPFAWRYRDWVVNAFNRDLPYDQFVKLQIAGDLAPAPAPGEIDKDALVATGVYVMGEWGIGDADKEKVVTDIVDDQVDLTGRAFLGLTLACARCHDHKFDPISARDYYGLAGMFFSSRIMPDPGAKGAGAPVIRVPLMGPNETARRQAGEARVAQLQQDLDRALDEQYAVLAAEMLPKVDAYLTAAWEYKNLPEASRPALPQFAHDRGLHGHALGQWLTYVGAPSLKLLPTAVKSVNGTANVDAWQGPEGGSPTVFANNTDAAVAITTLTLPPQSLSVHPSPTAGVAVAWKSAAAGRFAITGRIADGDGACGDGVTWSVSRLGGNGGVGELASGTIPNGGKQAFTDGAGGPGLAAVDLAAGEMIQLAILPKGEYTCDTTTIELEVAEIAPGGLAGRVWNLTKDVVPDLHNGNPHADGYGNPHVWHFHDLAGQAQSTFAAGSSMSKFAAALVAPAGAGADQGAAIRAAAAEVRAALGAVASDVQKLKAEGKDPASIAHPDAALYQALTAPRGSFWALARNDDSNLPAPARERTAGMRSEMAGLRETVMTPIPLAHAIQEGGTPQSMFPGIQDVPLHVRGSYTKLAEVVPRRLPQVLAGDTQPPITQGSGRKELAEWIAGPTNPLTARVMVNRIWQHHFGEGIVRTPNNYGKLGTPPTHPELLDHLASRFVALGWSVKAMHREIMLSAAYQQSSTADPATAKADPDNLLFGRQNRRRLDAEGLRDGLLALSGQLDPSLGGPAVNDLNTPRRTLYVMTVRSDRTTYRNLFDAADAGAIVEQRTDSTVAPQALFLLNNPFALAQTKRLAARALEQPGDDAARIDWLYRALFSRPATPRETEIGQRALARARAATAGEATSAELPWESYCQVLLCTNEFMYVD